MEKKFGCQRRLQRRRQPKMALPLTARILPLGRGLLLARPCLRAYSSAAEEDARTDPTPSPPSPPSPPLFFKLRTDLKEAMWRKDVPRRSILRLVLAEHTRLSKRDTKTDRPVDMEAQLLGLLRKMANQGREAASSFRAAGKEDLAALEETQVDILEGYLRP